MAISKTIRQNDGVPTSYHRIWFVQNVINRCTAIAVISYVDAASRQTECVENPPYRQTVTYEIPYKENFTIEDAYKYIKSLPEFEGSEDI